MTALAAHTILIDYMLDEPEWQAAVEECVEHAPFDVARFEEVEFSQTHVSVWHLAGPDDGQVRYVRDRVGACEYVTLLLPPVRREAVIAHFQAALPALPGALLRKDVRSHGADDEQAYLRLALGHPAFEAAAFALVRSGLRSRTRTRRAGAAMAASAHESSPTVGCA